MKSEDQYLRKLLNSPETLAQVERRAARVSDGMRRLRWALLDALQIGVLAAFALAPLNDTNWTWLKIVPLLPVALVAGVLATFVRRSFATNYFAKESIFSLVRRGMVGALMTFVAIGAFSAPWWSAPGAELMRVGACGLLSVSMSVALTLSLTNWSSKTGAGTSAVAVIGDLGSTSNVSKALRAGRWPGWSSSLQLNGTRPEDVERLRIAVANGEIDVVIIAVTGSADRVRRIVAALPDATARICVALDVPQQAEGEVAIWLVDLWRNPHDGIPGALKRMIDQTLSMIGLIILAPFFAVIALIIKLESPGPVFFRQWRFGACSRPFQVLKFRTMRFDLGDEKGAQRTVAQDPRVTRFGRIMRRTSIDELPQLFNVLSGDMSLVGPRAQALFMEINGELMFEALGDYPARHRVLPGITGWAQINGSRGEVDTLDKAAKRTKLDLWYIKNWSLWLDIRIILRTAFGGFANFNAD